MEEGRWEGKRGVEQYCHAPKTVDRKYMKFPFLYKNF